MKTLQHYIMSILAAVLIVVNIGAYVGLEHFTNRVIEDKIGAATEDLKNNISERTENYINMLYSLRGLFATSDSVSQSDWQAFMEQADIFARYPGADAFEYVAVVQSNQLPEFANSIRQQLGQDFSVLPEVTNPASAPVVYMETIDPYARKTIGYNMYTEPVRKQAMDYAMDNDSIAITNTLVPLTDRSRQQQGKGFVIFAPVYKNKAPVDTVEQRRQNIQGFVTAAVRPESMMKNLNLHVLPGLHFQIFDHTSEGALTEKSLLYNSGDSALTTAGYVSFCGKVDALRWPNMEWHIRYSTEPNLPMVRLVYAMKSIAMLSIFFVTVLIYAHVYNTRKHIACDCSINHKKPETLQVEDTVIDNSTHGIIVTDEKGVITVFNRRAEQVLGYTSKEVVGKMNLLHMLSDDTLHVYTAKISRELKEKVEPSFDVLITTALLNGEDSQKWLMVSRAGMPLKVDVTVRPLYDNAVLSGYQFNI